MFIRNKYNDSNRKVELEKLVLGGIIDDLLAVSPEWIEDKKKNDKELYMPIAITEDTGANVKTYNIKNNIFYVNYVERQRKSVYAHWDSGYTTLLSYDVINNLDGVQAIIASELNVYYSISSGHAEVRSQSVGLITSDYHVYEYDFDNKEFVKGNASKNAAISLGKADLEAEGDFSSRIAIRRLRGGNLFKQADTTIIEDLIPVLGKGNYSNPNGELASVWSVGQLAGLFGSVSMTVNPSKKEKDFMSLYENNKNFQERIDNPSIDHHFRKSFLVFDVIDTDSQKYVYYRYERDDSSLTHTHMLTSIIIIDNGTVGYTLVRPGLVSTLSRMSSEGYWALEIIDSDEAFEKVIQSGLMTDKTLNKMVKDPEVFTDALSNSERMKLFTSPISDILISFYRTTEVESKASGDTKIKQYFLSDENKDDVFPNSYGVTSEQLTRISEAFLSEVTPYVVIIKALYGGLKEELTVGHNKNGPKEVIRALGSPVALKDFNGFNMVDIDSEEFNKLMDQLEEMILVNTFNAGNEKQITQHQAHLVLNNILYYGKTLEERMRLLGKYSNLLNEKKAMLPVISLNRQFIEKIEGSVD